MMTPNFLNTARKILLPPESPQELFLRTIYHRINATPWFVKRQIKAAKASCQDWRVYQEQIPLPPIEKEGIHPLVAFLLATYNKNGVEALETLRSISSLHAADWQVIPVTPDGRIPGEFAPALIDKRVLPPVLGGALSTAISGMDGIDFLMFCTAGDLFDASLLDHFYTAISTQPSADLYYYDCEQQQGKSFANSPFFKPSAPSPELMFSFNYLSRGFIRRTSILEMKNLPSATDDPLVLEYALMKQLLDQRASTCHIPRLLASQAVVAESVAVGTNAVIQSHLSSKGLTGVKITQSLPGRRVSWDESNPSVSIIILNRDHGGWLRALVNSILNLTDYENYSLIIVDNNSTEADVLQFFDELENNERVQIVHYDREFNYSEAINIGVAHSEAEIIALLNNDMQVIDPVWLRELVRWASIPEIGVVGGKLLHRNHTIQHAGIILGMNGFIGHLYLNAPDHYHGLAGSVDWYRNFYALTGACQAMRRQLFHQVGGYDERFRLAFGDIDFCLRVFKAGYRNLYNPFAKLIHYEGGSRGYETPIKDILLGYEELGAWLTNDDAYFSPNLTYTPIPRCNFTPDAGKARLEKIENRKSSLEVDKKMAR